MWISERCNSGHRYDVNPDPKGFHLDWDKNFVGNMIGTVPTYLHDYIKEILYRKIDVDSK